MDVLVRIQRLGRADGDAVIIGAGFLIWRVFMGAIAVRAHPGKIVIAAGCIFVAVMGEFPCETIAALIGFAFFVVACRGDIIYFIGVHLDLFRTDKCVRSVVCIIPAHIHQTACAGACRKAHGEQNHRHQRDV